jgi:hypothetical protein
MIADAWARSAGAGCSVVMPGFRITGDRRAISGLGFRDHAEARERAIDGADRPDGIDPSGA